MNTLKEFNQQQQQHNQELTNQIDLIAQKLEDLKQQLKVEETRCTHQQRIDTEFQEQKRQFKKLLQASCSRFPVEALDAMAQELNAVVQEVKDDYEKLSQEDRYLDALSYEDEESNVIALEASQTTLSITEELPSEDDDIIELTPSQVETIIQPLKQEVIEQIKVMAKIHGKVTKLATIASHIAKIPVTHKRLKEFIKGVEDSLSFQTQLLA